MNVSHWLWMATAAALALGCGSDDDGGGSTTGGCNKNPSSCPADQTCWPKDTAGNYACLPAPATKGAGSACTIFAGAADCAPGHFCFPTSPGTPNGVCSPFCGADLSCPGGAQCAQVFLANTSSQQTITVCMPSGTGGAGGQGGAAGAGGAGGAAGGGAGGAAGGP